MKRFSLGSGQQMKAKNYLLYALGEILLIVAGILLALYINKLNSDHQYTRKIDENINRAYHELEKNLSLTEVSIAKLQDKDSLIHLFMKDSLVKDDYTKSRDFSGLIINSGNLFLEDDAFQNLLQLNVSDNTYRDALISDLKSLYSMNEKIKSMNERMSNFVEGILTDNVKDYGKFAYSGVVDENLIEYYLNSEEYKSNVIKYSVLAIRNQLKRFQIFYAKGRGIYQEISRTYDLPDHFAQYYEPEYLQEYVGSYLTSSPTDSLHLSIENDSVFLSISRNPNLHLVSYENARLYVDNGQLGYFVSFFTNDSSEKKMIIHLMSFSGEYTKAENEQ